MLIVKLQHPSQLSVTASSIGRGRRMIIMLIIFPENPDKKQRELDGGCDGA